MKKLIFSFALFCALCVTSCGNGAKTSTTETEAAVEVVEAVDSVIVATDTAEVEVTESEAVAE